MQFVWRVQTQFGMPAPHSGIVNAYSASSFYGSVSEIR